MVEEVTFGPYDEDKLTELVLYVAKGLQHDPQGGATKLNKCLYFADFSAVRRLGHPITGAESSGCRKDRPLGDSGRCGTDWFGADRHGWKSGPTASATGTMT